MATVETPREQKVVVKEMSWDPITRIVGSLGIHTEIDFSNRTVRALRNFTRNSLEKEPSWRVPGPALTTGYTR